MYTVHIAEGGVKNLKITMNINDDLLERVDRYAKINYLSRTSIFSFAVSQFLTTQELPSLMSNMNNAMLKIAETGTITEEQQKTLEAMQVFVDSLTSNK